MIRKIFNSESKSVTGAALVIGLSAIASRFLGLIRDRLMVSRFSIGNDLDSYYAAFQVPNLLFALLILGTLSVAFIPVFTEYLAKKREDEAWKMTNTILALVALIMGAACLLLMLGAPWLVRLIAPGFGGDKLALTVHLTRIMMISPFIFGISAVFSSVLNSFKRFVALSFAPLIYNFGIIFGITVLSHSMGIAGVAWGAIMGAILHLCIQIPTVLQLGWKPILKIDTTQPGVREVGRLFVPRIFGIDISQIAQFIGTSIGTTLGIGSPAIFNLAMNIAAVPVGAIAIPFGIAAFPNMSEAFAKGDRDEFVRVFASSSRQVLFFLAPFSALAIILRVHIVRVLLGSSNLTWDETMLTSTAFAIFCFSLVFQGLAPLLSRAFYAFKNTIIPVVVSGISVATYVLMAKWLGSAIGLAFKAGVGLGGIAMDVKVLALPVAFNAASVIQVGLLLMMLRKKFGQIGGSHLAKAFLLFIAGSIAAVICADIFMYAFPIDVQSATFAMILAQAAGASITGFAAYGLMLWLGKSEELENFLGSLKRKMMKVKTLPMQEADVM